MGTEQAMTLGYAVFAFWMLGQVWFVQIVAYPLFAKVGNSEYRAYHHFFGQRIRAIVIAPTFIGFLAPIPLALYGPPHPAWMQATNIVAGLVGMLITVTLEAPRNARLIKHGKDMRVIAELVRYNWPRTASISVQAAVALLMLANVPGG